MICHPNSSLQSSSTLLLPDQQSHSNCYYLSIIVVVVVVFIGEARKAKALSGSRAYGYAPLEEFLASNITPRLILRPRATFEY